MGKRDLSDEIAYIKRSFQRTGKQNPALMEIVTTFEGMALERAQIRAELGDLVNPPEFSMDRDAFIQGTPLFNNFELTGIEREFLMALKTLSPALSRAFRPLAGKIEQLNSKIDNKEITVEACVDAIVAGSPEKLEQLGKSADIPPEILQFILFEPIKIIFEIIRAKLENSMESMTWTKGYCPFCGSFPEISFLRADSSEKVKSEFLKAHGGQLWLHCSQCSHEWRIKRSSCVYCGSEDKGDLQYFSVEKSNKERIYTCNSCKRYIVSIDQREAIEPDHPEAAAVGAVPLNMVARQKGFTPMVNTPLHN